MTEGGAHSQNTAVRTGVASAAVVFSGMIWGIFWWPLRYFEGLGISAGWTIVAINLFPAAVMAAYALWDWRRQRAGLGLALAIGALAGVGLALYGIAIVNTSVIRATMMFYLTPVWGTLIGIVWLGEQAGWKRWIAIASGLAGVLVLVGGQPGTGIGIGDALAFASGVTWALAASLIRKFDHLPVASMTAFQFLCLSAGAVAIEAAISPAPPVAWEVLRPMLGFMLALAVFAVLPGTLALFWAQQRLYPGRVGLLMMSEVLVAVISASILLPGERLAPVQWIGALMIIAASVIELIPARRRRPVYP